MTGPLPRRRVLGGLATGGVAAATGSLILVGCDRISNAPVKQAILRMGQSASYASQRALLGPDDLAPEYRPDQRSPVFRTNGNVKPTSRAYQELLAGGFEDWRLSVGGLVERTLGLSLDQVRAMPARTQITRNDCVEGWSAIGEWTGVQLKPLLERARIMPSARYVVFHCADEVEGAPFYQSIDLADALHPQTILAWQMNGQPLSVGHGAPLRLRVERQLGYKQAKYVMAIEAVASLANIGKGRGGSWEDSDGYQWFAGI